MYTCAVYKVKWQHFKGVVENVTLPCRKFSQLSNSENILKICQQLIKLPMQCNVLLFGPPCIVRRCV